MSNVLFHLNHPQDKNRLWFTSIGKPSLNIARFKKQNPCVLLARVDIGGN
jgi:hypothetical protein